MPDRNELYQQMILEHNKNPRNFKEIANSSHSAKINNPLCGDELKIYLQIDKNIITDIGFTGSGCAISKSSASMMTGTIKGKTIKQANKLIIEFYKLANHKLPPNELSDELYCVKMFSNIWQYPSRIKCATLSWQVLQKALKNKD